MQEPQRQESVGTLVTTVIPRLFENPVDINLYGSRPDADESMRELEALMGKSPMDELARALSQIVEGLNDADPQKLVLPDTWWRRWSGVNLETKVRYHVARDNIDQLLSEAQVSAERVRSAIAAIDQMLIAHNAEVLALQVYVDAGRQYLANTVAVAPTQTAAFEFDNPRERFERRVANLVTLMASHEVSAGQLQLVRANAIDMLDRFQETARVLVPVWRQHTLSLTTMQSTSPDLLAQATQAHDALAKSLARALQPNAA